MSTDGTSKIGMVFPAISFMLFDSNAPPTPQPSTRDLIICGSIFYIQREEIFKISLRGLRAVSHKDWSQVVRQQQLTKDRPAKADLRSCHAG